MQRTFLNGDKNAQQTEEETRWLRWMQRNISKSDVSDVCLFSISTHASGNQFPQVVAFAHLKIVRNSHANDSFQWSRRTADDDILDGISWWNRRTHTDGVCFWQCENHEICDARLKAKNLPRLSSGAYDFHLESIGKWPQINCWSNRHFHFHVNRICCYKTNIWKQEIRKLKTNDIKLNVASTAQTSTHFGYLFVAIILCSPASQTPFTRCWINVLIQAFMTLSHIVLRPTMQNLLMRYTRLHESVGFGN